MSGDASYASVNHLILANGTNGQTTFPDSGPANRTITRQGSGTLPVVTTTNPKYGSGCAVIGASTFSTLIAPGASISLPGDFTVDAWIRLSAFAGQRFPVFSYNDGGAYAALTFAWSLSNTTTMLLETGTGPTNRMSGSVASGSLCDGNWHHVALTRASGVFRQYADGVNFGGSWSDSSTWFNSSASAFWGLWNAWGSINGYNLATFGYNVASAAMDCMRLTIGVARWSGTGSFTPPAAEEDYLAVTGGPFPHYTMRRSRGGLLIPAGGF